MANDFDELIGHSEAVVDTAGSCFAAELIEPYPRAKVVLNYRRNSHACMSSSMDESVIAVNRNWLIYALNFFHSGVFCAWNSWKRYLWPGLFQCVVLGEGLAATIEARGQAVYQGEYDALFSSRNILTLSRTL